ncbi:hypothetical protein ACNKHM_06615 [Shigella sonnei]
MQAETSKPRKMEELAMMGIVEVLGGLCITCSSRANLTKRFGELKPRCFVGIDALTSILLLKVTSKSRGIEPTHYVSPSVSGVATETRFKIGRATNLVLAFSAFRKTGFMTNTTTVPLYRSYHG